MTEQEHYAYPKQGQQSEVARLRQQIALEYEAATRGLHGLAQGTAQHAFITQRMENMAAHHANLQRLVGVDEAAKLLAETLEQMGDTIEKR